MKNNMFQMNDDRPDNGLEELMDEAFREFPHPPLRDDFTDTLLTRMKKQMAWREMITNFSLKILLVLGTLGMAAGILFLTYRRQELSFAHGLRGIWKPAITVVSLLFFTFLFDQILLPTLFRKKKPVDHGS